MMKEKEFLSYFAIVTERESDGLSASAWANGEHSTDDDPLHFALTFSRVETTWLTMGLIRGGSL
jgi:hypothetical protein